MQFSINETPTTVFETETAVIDAVVAKIVALPAGATVGLWPSPMGRIVMNKIGVAVKHPLVIYTCGTIAGVDLAEYIKPIVGGNKNITVVTALPQKINLAVVIPRSTSLDFACVTVDAKAKPMTSQHLTEEIGAAFGFEAHRSNEPSAAGSEVSLYKDGEDRLLLDDFITAIETAVVVFKGDLFKDCCASVLECRLGLCGQILKRAKCAAVADCLAASALTVIMKPWTVSGFKWTKRAYKMALSQVAVQHKCKIADLTDAVLKEAQIPLAGKELEEAKKYVIQDLQERVTHPDDGLKQLFGDKKLKVAFFSPHPDDDVISAGGSVLALARNHNIECHMIYCVAGSVATPDNFVLDKIKKHNVQVHQEENDGILGDTITYDGATHLTHKKLTDQKAQEIFGTGCNPRTKGLLREIEAQSGVAEAGIFDTNPKSTCNFLRLPFYGSGFGRRANPTHADVEKCLALLKKIQPDVVFLAGDLSDPHGTHGHCYFVIRDALEEYEKPLQGVPDEIAYSVYNVARVREDAPLAKLGSFVQQQKFVYKLLYRGAWAEFNPEDATVFIAFNQKDLDHKMRCIHQHECQMGTALYLGDDFRAFDVRAKERNIGTCQLLQSIGLIPNDVACECYVGCVHLP